MPDSWSSLLGLSSSPPYSIILQPVDLLDPGVLEPVEGGQAVCPVSRGARRASAAAEWRVACAPCISCTNWRSVSKNADRSRHKAPLRLQFVRARFDSAASPAVCCGRDD